MYRVAHALGRHHAALPARAVCIVVQMLTGADIEWRAQIGPGFFLEHPMGVVIGDGVVAGRNLVLGAAVLLGSSFYESRSRPRAGFPTLGDGVSVWAKASILGPVEVGDRAVIGAHALVLDDVPPDAVARGVPARSYVEGQQVPKAATLPFTVSPITPRRK
jgi:serine O-acetyltransferase